MEWYLNVPCFPRAFVYNFAANPDRVWAQHDHDRLTAKKVDGDVIYMWRDPVDTVFSQVMYMCGMVDDDSVRQVMVEYRRHLERWLKEADRIVTYEGMIDDPVITISYVLAFLHPNVVIDMERLTSCIERVDKKAVKEASSYEPRVMVLSDDYNKKRRLFRMEWQERIYEYFQAFCGKRSSPGT